MFVMYFELLISCNRRGKQIRKIVCSYWLRGRYLLETFANCSFPTLFIQLSLMFFDLGLSDDFSGWPDSKVLFGGWPNQNEQESGLTVKIRIAGYSY